MQVLTGYRIGEYLDLLGFNLLIISKPRVDIDGCIRNDAGIWALAGRQIRNRNGYRGNLSAAVGQAQGNRFSLWVHNGHRYIFQRDSGIAGVSSDGDVSCCWQIDPSFQGPQYQDMRARVICSAQIIIWKKMISGA